ncbi:MAG: type II toxin-antitoxin system HicB family antitoxin [Candidatus Sungiibacteriota bacterium]
MRYQKRYIDYRIVITPDTRTGSGDLGFTALVPVLGIATGGDSVEEALRNIQEMIVFHLECLRKEKQPLPMEQPTADFITTARVAVPA